jgi:hypothetical protein
MIKAALAKKLAGRRPVDRREGIKEASWPFPAIQSVDRYNAMDRARGALFLGSFMIESYVK